MKTIPNHSRECSFHPFQESTQLKNHITPPFAHAQLSPIIGAQKHKPASLHGSTTQSYVKSDIAI